MTGTLPPLPRIELKDEHACLQNTATRYGITSLKENVLIIPVEVK
jgi:hypothetical protein